MIKNYLTDPVLKALFDRIDYFEGSQEEINDAANIMFQYFEQTVSGSKPKKERSVEQTDGSKVWDAYAGSYKNLYGVEPIRNRTTNSQAKQLAERLGVDAACDVVRFYLNHTDWFFVKDNHPIGLCLLKAEALSTQLRTGKKITSIDAKGVEKNEHEKQVVKNVFNEIIGGNNDKNRSDKALDRDSEIVSALPEKNGRGYVEIVPGKSDRSSDQLSFTSDKISR